MSLPSSTEVITALTQGCNPSTGEQLEPGHLIHDPVVLRALFDAKAVLERRDAAERRRQLAGKSGAPWTPEEEAVLVVRFDEGRSFFELAKELSRSPGAVQARLIKLGKIEDSGQLRFIRRA